MKDNRRHLNLEWEGTSFEIWRLSEEEYDQLRQSSLPIKEDHKFLWRLYLSERNSPDRLTLPKAFLTLEHLFGKTSDFFDDWKGSFRFPLLLVVKKSQAFLKRIDSNSILYGCRAGELFEEEFESEEDYQQAIAAFEQTYGPEKSADKSRDIQLLLRQIIQ